MNEESIPDLGEHDWTAMEELANGVPEDAVSDGEISVVLTDDMILKRVLWDTAPHKMVQEIAEFLGLPTPSDEGVEMEHDEADRRLAAVIGLTPYLHILAKHTARSVVATMVVMEGDEDEVPLDGEDFLEQVERFKAVIFTSILAAFSEMIDWNIVHTPLFVITTVNEAEDDGSSE